MMLAAVGCIMAGEVRPLAQQGQARFLAKEQITFYGIGLKVEPARQVVPKDIATIVSTFLQAPTLPDGLPPFAPDAEVRGTLRGPSFADARELVVAPNTPFNIPPLTVPGIHTLENIRLISNGEVLLRGVPESVVIDVIEKLLITQVTARALTAAEIREKGIVFDKSSFQAYNFSAAFAIEDRKVTIDFPVVLPQLQGAQDVSVDSVSLPQIVGPALPNLQTIIPDTLKLQTQIPNLSVIGFTLKVPELQGQNLFVPPIPGVIVIPGDIGFLNQFFSVMLMVGNVAPAGSNLVVSQLEAEIVLPPGNDLVVGSGDDPLRMARTAAGETLRKKLVVQPGPDGQLGTADDIGTIGPGDTGNAEYLVEGMREGSHVVEMEMSGILNGLPIGPVPIRGRAAGAVLVRNPTFTLTFTHPEVVSAGEPYTLDVTVTNTGQSPANFVSLNLYPRNVSGATIVGSNSREIESILPGDSSTVAFDLISRITGKVTAATLDSTENVAGRFALKTAVGELGVPLSPDSLVLPKESRSLPQSLREAAIGLLGKAWAVATAPGAALPKDVQRFSKKIVIDRAVEVAEAGFRVSLHEPLPDSAAHLAMDFLGNKYAWLPQLNPRPDDLAFAQENFTAFDALRRQSVRGDRFADAVAALLAPDILAKGPQAFHADLESRWSYRPEHLSAFIAGIGGNSPAYRLSLFDAEGRRVGGAGENGKIIKQIPHSDLLVFAPPGGALAGEMAVVGSSAPGTFTVRLDRVDGVPDGTPYVLSLVVPDATGTSRHLVFQGTAGQGVPVVAPSADPYQVLVEVFNGGTAVTGDPLSAQTTAIVDPPPTILGVVQQVDADTFRCDPDSPGVPLGRVIAVLFSEEVTAASVQDKLKADEITNYSVDRNLVVGVALQPGRRIAFLALRDPYGPFVPAQLTVSNVMDVGNQAMPPVTLPIESTISGEGGVVSGKVIRADGTPIPFASVRLFYLLGCESAAWVGISAKTADEQGRYGWDYVSKLAANRIVAVDSESEEFRDIRYNVQRNGQRLNVDIVLLGRGTFQGRTLGEDGRVLSNTAIKVTSLTDNSSYGATTDADGRFAIGRIPVGNVLVEAINVTARAQFFLSENIPFAGATTSKDITLLDVELREITVKNGRVQGFVYEPDGTTPLGDVPVYAYYQTQSQPGVRCPEVGSPPREPLECAVALARTTSDGAFLFEKITAGALRLYAFDQGSLAQGGAHVVLPADATRELNVLLAGGLGTVNGRVVDPAGNAVVGARVGGGFTLTTTNAQGEFTLTDVPVGQRDIVAVSDELGTSGSLTVDIARAGEAVGATIVLRSVGSVAGRVTLADGTSPASGVKVHLFKSISSAEGRQIQIIGVATTDASGGYRIGKIQMGSYEVSAFTSDFSAGNVSRAVLKFHQQVFKADIKFRGGGGSVHGVVYDDDGQTPLKARLGISGDQVVVAGGQVGVGFEYVQNFKIVDTNFTTGQYSLGGLWVGPFTLRAVGQFSPDPIAVESAIPAPNESVEVNLRLLSTSRISGIVYQPNGVTPVGANVVVNYKSDEFKVFCSEDKFGEETCITIPQGIQSLNAVTDTDGRFFLPIVNAGSFTLTVEDPASGKLGRLGGSVKAGETADLSVRLLGMADVSVQVFASNATTPIPGAKVEIEQLAYPRAKKTLIAGPGGAVVFGGGDAFSEGDLVVTATDQRNGFAGRASAKVVTDGGTILVKVYLYNASGSVYGTVYKSDGITPVPNAEVIVSNSAGPLTFAVTDADGTYRQDLIPLGVFYVETFEAATARRAFASGRVDLNHQEVPVNLVQSALGIVKGRLMLGGSLAPLKGWEITLNQWSESGRSLPTLKTNTSIDGSWSFPGTSRGTFRATARKPDVQGTTFATGEIEREGQVVDVPLIVNILRQLTGRVEGTVFNPDGTRAANSSVEICYPGVCGLGGPPARLTTDADGFYFLDDVPLGRFSVTAAGQVTRNVGRGFGDLEIDGDVIPVDIRMVGLTVISGVVLNANGTPATSAIVRLDGSPATGCLNPEGGPGTCTQGVKPADGTFSFVDVPARTFTVSAEDAVSALKGAVGGVLNPGEHKTVTVVLEPTGSVRGRVFTAGGKPAQGIVAELILTAAGTSERRLYMETKMDGSFLFDPAPLAAYTLVLQDPIGSGLAQRSGTVAGNGVLGDIVLDEAPPAIASSVPAASASAVPQNQVITLTFTEAILPGTVNATNVVLESPTGPITYALNISNGDTVATLTPLVPLDDETRYVIRVENVKDRVGKVMGARYTTSFTTVDITAPSFVSINPAVNANGVPVYTPVRIQFSEPIDPARLRAPPFTMTGPQGTIPGRLDYTLGNTVLVFTPNLPLADDSAYRVVMSAAVDPAGNAQPQDLDYTFTTTDRTPPQILGLTAANNGTVIENTTTSVAANVGLSHDIAVVDWYINDVFIFAGRAVPFVLNFKAIPDFGVPGSKIKVSAIAIDTSGNRGLSPVTIEVLVTPDEPPTATIVRPAGGTSARNGDRIVVDVQATDDVGLTHVGYKPGTGQPQDAVTRRLDPSVMTRTESFAFTVPATAAPGSSILIEASVVDLKGHVVQATPVSVTVLDAVNPVVTITGTTSGAKVNPGQTTSAIVSAEDLGGITSMTFTVGGLVTSTETRALNPAQNAVAASFAIQVPANAIPGQTLTLDATVVDQAGNRGTAARVILPVADTVPPTVRLTTASGELEMVAGRPITVYADAEDGIAVSRVELTGQGAFAVSDAKAVSPPVGSARLEFTINVPANLGFAAVLSLRATAVDISGNVSAPATLTLTSKSLVAVTLPESVVVIAGESTAAMVQLAEPAPAGGLRVDFSSVNGNVASVTPFVQFAAGETSREIQITGVSGGSSAIRALIQGVERASMTATVRGGVVRGVVRNSLLQPVGGVALTINGVVTAETNGNGEYFAEGVPGATASVKALDPVTRQRGHATASMNLPGGYAFVNLVLIPAGAISGDVRTATGVSAGAGVAVEVFAVNDPYSPLDFTFTNDAGGFEFPVVTQGSYVLHATSLDGHRGRSTVTVGAEGNEEIVPIAFLGEGTVVGTVLDGSGAAVPRAPLTFVSFSVFGSTPTISVNAEADGTFRFERVLIGTFTIQARDLTTGQGGTASGAITRNGEIATSNVNLSTFASLRGTVRRPDGITPAVGARVTVLGHGTETNALGEYEFAFLPLGPFTVTVYDSGTRQQGRAAGTLTTQGETQTVDVRLHPQGSVIVTVTDAGGNPVAGAFVRVEASGGGFVDTLTGTTGADGKTLIERVLVGNLNLTASAGNLFGRFSTTLTAGPVKPITVTLEPTGTIAGVIYEPDGQTPATGARVDLDSGDFAITGIDGAYRFEGLPVPPRYQVFVRDPQGRLRALTRTGVKFTGAGQLATRDFTMVGLGTVNGRVLNPDSSSAQDLGVYATSFHPDFGGVRGASTNAGGFYTIESVPVGPFSVWSGDAGRLLLGEGAGTLEAHNGTATVDIVLTSNAVTPPVDRYDANNYRYDIQRNGSLLSGSGSFRDQGGLVLDVVSAGVATRFEGAPIATIEDGGREVAVSQQGIAGLNVTRKISVPRTGFFSRHLDIFRNPTAQPITVDVRVSSQTNHSLLLMTSSGDTLLDVTSAGTPDRWLVLDDAADPNAGVPATAFVFDGPEGADRADVALLSAASPRQLTYEWQSVTVAPNGTVAYLYFVAQQTSRAAAQASAERIVLLGPETLEGLGLDELAAIRNFVAPADGRSLVEALPRLDGVVSGRALEGDGTSTVGGANITFRSSHPLFGRSHSLNTNADGTFAFTSVFNDNASSRAIPAIDFTVQGRHPASNVLSPVIPGTFPDGAVSTDVNVPFSNTGMVRGVVRRHNGIAVTTGTVTIAGQQRNIASDASFAFTGITPGTYDATAMLGHPQGTALFARQQVTIAAGALATETLTIEPTGSARGGVFLASGSPAVNVQVRLTRTGFIRTTNTDTAGQYSFPDAPTGTFTVASTDPATGLAVSREITVAQDAATQADNLTFVPSGSAQVEVRFGRGALAANAQVHIREAARGNAFRFVGFSDSQGRITIGNVPVGALVVRAHHPSDTRFNSEVGAELATDGQVVPVAVVLPGMGEVTGRVTNEDGTPAVDVLVSLRSTHPTLGGFFNTRTDVDGVYRQSRLAIGPVSATVFDSVRQLFGEAFGTVETDGQVVMADIHLTNNAVGLTAYRYDANNFLYDIARHGGIETGSNSVFIGYSGNERGAMVLDVVAGGTAHRFTGSTIGTVEQDGREIAIRQQNLGGLDVTRKIYVPRAGYFARYLDTLSNPSSEPIIVDVRIQSGTFAGYYYSPACGCYSYHRPSVTRTSSGDNTLDVSSATAPDRWVTMEDTDPYKAVYGYNTPSFGFVFDGPNGSQRAGAAGVTFPTADITQVAYEWRSVTVPANGAVSLMHFVLQQTSQASAQAAAERLAQAPPEALDGMNAEELASVTNHALPADGLSTVAALPALTGMVTGRALASDNTTPLASATVRFRSAHPLFQREQTTYSDATGAYLFRGVFAENGSSTTIPIDSYSVTIQHPQTSVLSLAATGDFTGTFTGNLARFGTARASSEYVYYYGPSNVIDGNTSTSWHTGYAQSASYGATPFVEVVLPGAASVTHVNIRGNVSPGNDFLRGRVELFNALDEVLHAQEVDLPAPSRTVELDVPDTEGVRRVRFTGLEDNSVIPGISEFEIIGSLPSLAGVSKQDVALTNSGTIRGRVLRSNGTLAGSGTVYVNSGPSYGSSNIAPDGTYTLTGLQPGFYQLYAYVPHPQGSTMEMFTTVTVAAGPVTTVDITLPVTGSVTGIVTTASGGPAQSVSVYITGTRYYQTYTAADGTFTLGDVLTGAYTLVATEPNSGIPTQIGVTVVPQQTITQNLTLVGLGTVQVTVSRASGVPASNSLIHVVRAGLGYFQHAGYTNSLGQLSVPNVPVGDFSIRAHHPANTTFYIDVAGTVNANGDVVPLSATLPTVGSITGRVTTPAGSPSISNYIQLRNAAGQVLRETYTNQTGIYAFTDSVGVGASVFTRAYHSSNFSFYRDSALESITSDGEARVADLVLPAIGTLRVTVLKADGTPFQSARIETKDDFRTFFQFRGYTSASGQLTLSGQPEGATTIRVRDPNTGIVLFDQVATIAAANNGQTLDVLIQINLFAGAIQGTVRTSDSLVAIADSFVELLNAADNLRLASTTSNATGGYTFSNVLAGNQGFIVRAHAPNDTTVIVDRPGSFTTGSEALTIDLPLPALQGRIDGHVFAADATTPVASVNVQVFAASNMNRVLASTSTDGQGVFTFDNLLVRDGSFVVRVSTSVVVDQPGTFAASGDTAVVNVTVPVHIVTLRVRVFAADRATPIRSTYVQLLTNAGSYLSETYTDEQGVALFERHVMPAEGVRVAAYYQRYPDYQSIEVPVAIAAGGDMQVDAVLPLSIVKGRVTFHNGTAVQYPSVFVQAPGEVFDDGEGGLDPISRYQLWSDANGNYAVFGPPVGPIKVVAQDGDSALAGSIETAISALDVPAIANVQLPPSGTVTVRVLDASGSPVQDAEVSLRSSGVSFDRTDGTDETGTVVFDRVAVGPVSVQARVYISPNYFYASGATLNVADGTAAVDLRFREPGTLSGLVTKANGTPLSGAYVYIRSFGSIGPMGYFSSYATTGADGRYQATVPPGPLQVAVLGYDEADASVHGFGTGSMGAGGTLTLNLVADESRNFNVNLDGADGFRYDVRSDGTIGDGGLADATITDAYDTAMELVIDDDDLCCANVPRFELNGRQVIVGPEVVSSLLVTRKVFVPAAGGFARYLESISNPTSVPQTVRVRILTDVGADNSTAVVVVAPADTANTYAITQDAPGPCDSGGRPALAHVFGGTGAPVSVSSTDFRTGEDDVFYQWTVTIPPGETIALLHFTAQRLTDPASSQAAARAQAEALVNLTDPAALEGLTQQELGQIVNFTIPTAGAVLRGTIEGTAFAGDGATPIPGALVQATDAATGFFLKVASTDAVGHYRLENVPGGSQGVRVIAHMPLVTGDIVTRDVSFSAAGETLSNVNLTVPVSVVKGTVTSGGTPVASPIVFGSVVDALGVPHTFAARDTGNDGSYLVVGLPAGEATIFAQDIAGTSARGTAAVSASGATVLDLQLSAAAVCSPSASVTAWWSGDATPASRMQGGPAGTLANGAGYAPARVADGFNLDGVDDLVTFPDSPAVRGERLSISVWVKFGPGTAAAPFDRDQTVLYKRNATPYFQWDGWSGAYMIFKDANNQFVFSTTTESAGGASVAGTTTLEPNRFYHVAATFDGSTMMLYVDGMLEGRSNAQALEHGSGPLMLGGTAAPEYDPRCNCTVDEPQVYSRALGPDEVQSILAAGAAGTCDAFRIANATLPDGYAHVPVNEQLLLVGGVAPSTFSVDTGSTLPAGLTLSETGLLSGTPTGTFSFDVVAIDAVGTTTAATVSKKCLPCSVPPGGLIALWPANETAADVVSNNGGTLLNGARLVAGHAGRAFAFDGDGGFVFPRTQPFSTPSNTFTMEFWALPGATRPATIEAVGGISGNGGQRYAIAPEYRGISGEANAGVSVGTNGISVFEHGPSYLPSPLVYGAAISGWTHVAVVYENRIPSLYVDGVFVRSGLQSTQNVSPSKRFGDHGGYGPYQGLLDDVAIYNRALSAAEIAALAAGADGKCPLAGGG